MSLLINHFYRFGEFTLDADQKVLLREEKPVALPPKVFGTLLILVENSRRIVSKEELMTRLWPDTFVEEANLTYSIQQLRKILGDNARDPVYIETVPRRGYRFIADVEEVLSDKSPASSQPARRFETSDSRSLDAGYELSRPEEAQESEQTVELAKESHSVTREKNLDAMVVAGAASKYASKKQVAFAVALVVVLAGVALIFWKFSTGSNKNPGENSRVDGKSVVAQPLKLEKLTGTGESRLAAISPDGKYIAYTRHVQRKANIWLRHLATNTNVEIVPATGPELIHGLQFANSGEYLFFVKGTPTALYRVSLVGGVPAKIIENLQGKFSISSDDGRIAFIRQTINRDGQREYYLMIANSDGTGERTLLVGTHPDDLEAPVWSPDGGAVICAYGSAHGGGQNVRLIEVGVADGAKRELSPDRFFNITKIAWLPDKSGLIMTARKNEGNNQLWRVSYPGMEISRITEELSAYLDLSIAAGTDKAVATQATRISDIWVGSSREPQNLKRITQAIDNFCWTPNKQLVYSTTASGNTDLWIMQPDGSGQRQLTVSAGVNGTPTATPDNRYIVFISDRTGASQIWRMNLDGSNQVRLTNGAGKNLPAISPDGKWVYYNTTDDWHLWKVSIDGGEPTRLTEYFALRPSVSPDGKMIVCVGRTESKRQLLILPIEGGQPLKKLDFAGWDSRLQWTPNGKALTFAGERNRVRMLMKQSLDGSPPEEIADFDEGELFDFGYSIDGQFLAVTRGGWQHDVVLISNLNRH